MATDCRSRPDSVPTACVGSRTSMPISAIACRAIVLARSLSMRDSGQRLRAGSRPRKKLRVIDISEIMPRSWNTVATPRS